MSEFLAAFGRRKETLMSRLDQPSTAGKIITIGNRGSGVEETNPTLSSGTEILMNTRAVTLEMSATGKWV